jgi:hypothetical protein
MVMDRRNRWIGVGAILLSTAAVASAQNSSDAIIGPPQLKDFSLQPRETIVRQPAPAPAPPAEVSPPSPAAAPPSAETRSETPSRPAATPSAPAASAARRAPAASPAAPVAPEEAIAEAPSTGPIVPVGEEPAPVAVAAAPDSAPAAPSETGTPYWYLALPAAALALLGAVVVHRRRRSAAEPIAEPAPAAAAPPPAKPRPDPVPRPWLEIGFKADRAAFTDSEAEIAFELEISNKGGSPARNLRIDVKLFNAGAEQDKEIGAFFRTAGRETTKLKLPGVAAGVSGMIQGTVGMKREDMRAMRLDERLLFIPVLAVNILYDWGEGRTGQTSKSYVIGRELQTPSEKMGAFRVDQGPRVWRTVGQRPHKLARRV